ncbi:MAG: tagaturonate epimerase family protein [Verrucomicrobiae bacterium]|nr:tagaturonate epimerase family protein [Verrucomicrobiae bacterium]
MITLERFSMGIGDRFGQEGEAQLAAFVRALAAGVEIIPVWNKSNREHTLIGTDPASVRAEADAATGALGWKRPYRVDADHIGLKTVDRFLAASDFFTIDVADFIGQPVSEDEVRAFVARHQRLLGGPFGLTSQMLERAARKYLLAVQEAARVYRYLEKTKGTGQFIAEVSMDETDTPQTPPELLVILAALAEAGVQAQTIAPKFSGRFNKGVDYVGDLARFEREFAADLAVVAFAVREFGLPANLKLSIHSGSDKFSLYPIVHRQLRRSGAGVHVKTAGTTWLEEVAGLARAGGEALRLAKEMYAAMFARREELAQPYRTVIEIDPKQLPDPATVNQWTSDQFVAALRHDPKNPRFNPHFRQLVHVGFKVAAERGREFRDALTAHRALIAEWVTDNLYRNHIAPLFLGANGV